MKIFAAVLDVPFDVSSLTLQTEDVNVMLNKDNRIILNCTAHKDDNEEVLNSIINWQKQSGDKFKDIATFLLYGYPTHFIVKDMEPVYNNRTELITPNNSLAAVMIIKDPVCSDNGAYQCEIKYISDRSHKSQTSRYSVEFNGKYGLFNNVMFYKNSYFV